MTPSGVSPVLDAPPAWRAIDFISDIHLAPDLPQTADAWAAYMRNSGADAIVVLGDLFEVWVGDDARHEPFEAAQCRVLAEAARRRPLYFMAGNRDFLVGDELCRDVAFQRLNEPTVLRAWGRTLVLCHGDAQCLSDTGYQAFRAQVRQPGWQAAFLARPLAERQALAREMRKASAEHQARAPESYGDLDAEACRQLLLGAGASTLVHGHTHRPAVHDLGAGLSRHVLSDWDLDHAGRAEVTRLSPDGQLRRLTPEQACARA